MIEHQKAVAKSVLKKLQTLDLYAVLAGGACRDWLLDKEATDLDFYMYYNPKYPSSSLEEVLHFQCDAEQRRLADISSHCAVVFRGATCST